MPRKPDPETLKIAKELRKDYKKLINKRKSQKVFKKDVKEISKKLNNEARRIARQSKKTKVLDVQHDILGNFEKLS